MQNISLKRSNVTHKYPLRANNNGFNTTFESEKTIDEREEKFAIKKELYRGIRDNDVQKIAGKSGDNVQESDFVYDEFKEVHEMLTEMRRKQDEVKTQTNSKKKEIEVLKKELEDLRYKQSVLEEEKQNCQQLLKKSQQILIKEKELSETCTYTRDVFNNIFQRTKKDIILLKKRLFETELEVSKVKNKFRNTATDATNKKKVDEQCQKMLASMERVVEMERQKRESRIMSMEDVLIKKQESIFKKTMRDKEIEEVVINALNEKSPQEKEWHRLLLANKLLSNILKTKIESELAKNTVIEKAFHNIKLNTGVTQSDVFVERFLNREQTYGQLLNSISEKEPKLQKEQQLNQKLKYQLKQLMEDRESQPVVAKVANVKLDGFQKEIDQVNKKLANFERQRENMYQWCIKFMKRYDALEEANAGNTKKKGNNPSQSTNYYDMYHRKDLHALTKKVFEIINKLVEEVATKEKVVEGVLLEDKLTDTVLASHHAERNIRIMTEMASEREQDDNVGFDDATELEYLHEQRRAIKRDLRNRKFRVKTKPF